MENNLQIFKNEEFGEIRTITRNNEPMFCLADTCRVLEIRNPSDAKTRLKQDGVVSTEVGVTTGTKKDGTPAIQTISMSFISESNLYKLIFQSRKPQAEKFSDWVTAEVLPTIRKTGGYVNNDELFIETYLPYVSEETKLMFRNTLATVREQNAIIKKQEKEIIHKEDVIVGLVDDIDLATKRQRITQIIKYRSNKYKERYSLLYSEFERKYHVNLKRRIEGCDIKPKIKSKLDYIDRGMNKIPELYELACKLFENDVKNLMKEWEITIERN